MQISVPAILKDIRFLTSKYLWEVIEIMFSWWNDHDAGRRAWTRMIAGGTATNDSASSGQIGEVVSSVASATNAPTSNQYGDLTSISLTAGDWDVSFNAYWSINGSTWTDVVIGISSNSGNSGTGLTDGDNKVNDSWASSSTTPALVSQSIVPFRVSLSSTTTYYAKFLSVYSAGGPPQCRGRISARRPR